MTDSDTTVIRLDADTSIVLLDLLARWIEDPNSPRPPDACFESRAECAALSEVLAQMEGQLVAPLKPEYRELLEAARDRLALMWPEGLLSQP